MSPWTLSHAYSLANPASLSLLAAFKLLSLTDAHVCPSLHRKHPTSVPVLRTVMATIPVDMPGPSYASSLPRLLCAEGDSRCPVLSAWDLVISLVSSLSVTFPSLVHAHLPHPLPSFSFFIACISGVISCAFRLCSCPSTPQITSVCGALLGHQALVVLNGVPWL